MASVRVPWAAYVESKGSFEDNLVPANEKKLSSIMVQILFLNCQTFSIIHIAREISDQKVKLWGHVKTQFFQILVSNSSSIAILLLPKSFTTLISISLFPKNWKQHLHFHSTGSFRRRNFQVLGHFLHNIEQIQWIWSQFLGVLVLLGVGICNPHFNSGFVWGYLLLYPFEDYDISFFWFQNHEVL